MTMPHAVSHAETPDLEGAYPRLSPEQIDALARLGARRETQAGEVLFQAGDTSCDFFVIAAGVRGAFDALDRDAAVP